MRIFFLLLIGATVALSACAKTQEPPKTSGLQAEIQAEIQVAPQATPQAELSQKQSAEAPPNQTHSVSAAEKRHTHNIYDNSHWRKVVSVWDVRLYFYEEAT